MRMTEPKANATILTGPKWRKIAARVLGGATRSALSVAVVHFGEIETFATRATCVDQLADRSSICPSCDLCRCRIDLVWDIEQRRIAGRPLVAREVAFSGV